MALDDMSASDVPGEGDRNPSLAPVPVSGAQRSIPEKFDGPLAAAYVIHSIPGRVRLRVPSFKAGSQLARGLEVLLSTQIGITETIVNTGCHSVTVLYDPAEWTSESLCLFLHSRSREELELCASVPLADEPSNLLPMNWLQPWRFSNTTGGSPDSKGALEAGEPVKSGYWKLGYASMVVGAVLLPVPLVPGIPFLILSSYFFAKATVLKEADGPEAGEQVPKAKEKGLSG
jgi:hypothetical protein